MTRRLQSAPCRQISLAIDDELLALLDDIRRADPAMPSRSEVARTLMWSGAAVLLAAAADPLDEGATVPLRDVVPAGAA